MRVGTYLPYNKNSQPSNCLRCAEPREHEITLATYSTTENIEPYIDATKEACGSLIKKSIKSIMGLIPKSS